MRRLYSAWKIALIIILFTSVVSFASPSMEVKIGFSGRFVPEKLVPAYILISGVKAPISGSILFTQKVGNPWRGEAESQVSITFPLLTDGVYERLVPIYDFTHPLKVKLVDQNEKTLATTQVNLRPNRRDEPFPLAVGEFPFRLEEDVISVDSTQLPKLWPAYQSVDRLLIGRPSQDIHQSRWEAISRWTLAGGTVVLFTGADFYLLDSVTLRELLPLENPQLAELEDGSYCLAGDEKPSSHIFIAKDGSPLLIKRSYGTGEVFLVTKSAFDLEQNEWNKIQSHITPAKFLSFAHPTSDLLKKTELQRPSHWAAILLLFLILITFTTIASKPRKARRTLAYLLSFGLFLIILTGLYLNGAKTIDNLYCVKASIFVETSVGYKTDWYGLFAISPGEVKMKLDGVVPILQTLPRSLKEHNYNIRWKQRGDVSVVLDKAEGRYLHTWEDSMMPLEAKFHPDERVEINNRLDKKLEEAFVFSKGKAFSIGRVTMGKGVYYLVGGTSLEQAATTNPSFNILFQQLLQEFTLKNEDWLVGATEANGQEKWGNLRVEFRDVRIYVVKGVKVG